MYFLRYKFLNKLVLFHCLHELRVVLGAGEHVQNVLHGLLGLQSVQALADNVHGLQLLVRCLGVLRFCITAHQRRPQAADRMAQALAGDGRGQVACLEELFFISRMDAGNGKELSYTVSSERQMKFKIGISV